MFHFQESTLANDPSSSQWQSDMCSNCKEMLTITNVPADTLFRVLSFSAQALQLCTVSWLGAAFHANRIPMSGHHFAYHATRVSSCQSSTPETGHGLGIHSQHVLYVGLVHCSIVELDHCDSVHTRLVCIQLIQHRRLPA